MLTIHGSVVGIGWFVVALPSLLAIQGSSSVQDWFGDLAPAVQGMLGVVVVVSAFPLLWPVYLAIGWYETQAATRGESTAVLRGVQRVLNVQAVVTLAAAVGVAILAVTYRSVNGGEYLTLAWAPLAAIALGHLWTGRQLGVPGRS